jgi:hypothetical protein
MFWPQTLPNVVATRSPRVLIAKRELKILQNKGKGTFKYKKGVDKKIKER